MFFSIFICVTVFIYNRRMKQNCSLVMGFHDLLNGLYNKASFLFAISTEIFISFKGINTVHIYKYKIAD